jgi:hypothetical protein
MPTEAGRHILYEQAKKGWGKEAADELMSLLPPVGWADVATKSDLNHLAGQLSGEIGAFRAEMRVMGAELRTELHKGLASMQRWMVTALIATGGTLFAALRLTGTS